MTKGVKLTGRPRLFEEKSALDAAMKVFWSQGYEATSYSRLSKAMNMNTPSIYGAFGDKEDLFLKVIDRYVEVYGKPAFAIFSEAETCREGFDLFLSLKIREYLNIRASRLPGDDSSGRCRSIVAQV